MVTADEGVRQRTTWPQVCVFLNTFDVNLQLYHTVSKIIGSRAEVFWPLAWFVFFFGCMTLSHIGEHCWNLQSFRSRLSRCIRQKKRTPNYYTVNPLKYHNGSEKLISSSTHSINVSTLVNVIGISMPRTPDFSPPVLRPHPPSFKL